jgi:hypothetical protein
VAAQNVPERGALDELHHDRRARRRLDVLVQPDHVRVVERGQHLGLGPEHRDEIRIIEQRAVQVLDCHQGA